MRKSNPALLKIIEKKVNLLNKIDREYYDYIENQRVKNNILEDSKFELHFPENLKTTILGCVDGAIIIKHKFDIKKNPLIIIEDIRLEIKFKNLFIPFTDTHSLDLSPLININLNTDLTLIDVNLNDVKIDYLRIYTLKYNSEKLNSSFQDVMDDLKLTYIADNLDIENQLVNSKEAKSDNVLNKLKELLENYNSLLKTATREEDLQNFIKENPIILQPYSKVIPKQRLGEDFITDFVFANTLDQGINYTFIEIERVSMPVFTKNGDFTADFNHSIGQTLDWESWLEINKAYLQNKLNGLETPKFLVVAGRSVEFTDENKAKLRVWNRRQNNTEFLTYDDVSFRLKELINNLESTN